MAAYAATVTLAQPTVHKIGKLGVLRGVIDVTNYNSTKVAIAAITSRFKGVPTVLLGGCSSGGHLVFWDAATSSVKAFNPAGTLAQETANDLNVGTVPFTAIGVAP